MSNTIVQDLTRKLAQRQQRLKEARAELKRLRAGYDQLSRIVDAARRVPSGPAVFAALEDHCLHTTVDALAKLLDVLSAYRGEQ